MSFHAKPLVFIGPMGSGKSSLARRVAGKYGGEVFDTDREFVRRYGDISDFFQKKGESEFRRIESELLKTAVRSGAAYIATGGGAVLNRSGMCALRKSCDIVFLNAPISVLDARIRSSTRPLKGRLEELTNERMPLYKKYADYEIDTSVDSLAALERAVKQPRKNRYDIVLCDSDDTLLDFGAASAQSVRNTAREMGLSCDEDAVVKAHKSVTCAVWKKLERGEITRGELETERVKCIGEILGIDIDPVIFNRIYVSEMKKTRHVLVGATDFLSKLKSRGIRAYIITNSFTRIAEERVKPLLPYVSGAFISESIGAYKPDVNFFEKVCGAIGGVDKSRIVVFGDSETSDIAGGRAFGVDTCLFDVTGKKQTAADYSVASYDRFLDLV